MKIVEKFSDNYGKINFEFVGNVDYDLLKKSLDFDIYRDWAKKYHPTVYFPSCFFERKRTELSEIVEAAGFESENVDVFTCVDDINKDWDSTYWIQKYNLKNKNNAKLPIVISRRKVEVWQDELKKLYSLIK